MVFMKLFDRLKQLKNFDAIIAEKQQKIDDINKIISDSQANLDNLSVEIGRIRQERDSEVEKTRIAQQTIIENYKNDVEKNKAEYETQYTRLKDVVSKTEDVEKKFNKFSTQLKTARKIYRQIFDAVEKNIELDSNTLSDLDLLAPTVEIPLHAYDVKDLRELIKQTNKVIKDTLEKYEKRYTTKANRAIYQLMVLALQAEIQNILADLKYSTLNKCKDNLKIMLGKYLTIADDGNQTISGTLKNFINEIGVLFEQLVDIEYQYYIRKEQAKAEQQALKEQMRQEAEERRQLENERKHIEREEQKYLDRVNELNEQLSTCEDDERIKQLQMRINELTEQLTAVQEKKEEIVTLQNGKAGYVYVISNLGSFGNDVFKIGMTRRIDPMERVRELGSASVPFSFDVHSFIFSDDAVALEHKLHTTLDEKRVNKVNLRKEFFKISIDDLETLVQKFDPTAEFKKTMIASEFYQTQALNNE